MKSLSAGDMLQVWEQGQGQRPLDRALTLLAAACPEQSREELASLSIGARDMLLLEIRERAFGSQLDGFASCPQCNEQLEFSVSTSDFGGAFVPPSAESSLEWEMDGYQVAFRLPNSLDLAAVAHNEDSSLARWGILARCVTAVQQGSSKSAVDELPEAVLTAIEDKMVESDPLANVDLNLLCPGCAYGWSIGMDIESFLWTEIHTQAKRLMGEVHILARAYGWSEKDILSMSAPRRQRYVEMVNS